MSNDPERTQQEPLNEAEDPKDPRRFAESEPVETTRAVPPTPDTDRPHPPHE